MVEVVNHHGVGEDMVGTGGAGGCLGAWKIPWLHQHQPPNPHVGHGAGGGTDIAGMGGLHQHYSDIIRFFHYPIVPQAPRQWNAPPGTLTETGMHKIVRIK